MITTTMITTATKIVPTRGPIILDVVPLTSSTFTPKVVSATVEAGKHRGSLKELRKTSQLESTSKSTCSIGTDALPLVIQF